MSRSVLSFAFVSILSGVIYAFSQPKFDVYFLAPVFYIPLHIYYRKTGRLSIYLAGGVVSYFITIYWITYAITRYGGFPYLFAILPLLVLSFVLGMFFWVFGYIRYRIRSSFNIPYSIIDPVVWTSTEYVKTFLFTGFPWALLGYSLWRKEIFIQIADIGGVYMISFFILTISGFLCDVYEEVRNKVYLRVEGRSGVVLVSFVFVLLFTSFVVLYGMLRRRDIENLLNSQKDEITAVIVQPSIPQDEKWTPQFKDRYLRLNMELTLSAIDFPYDEVLAIWPETGLTFYLEHEPVLRQELLRFSRKGFYIVTGGLGISYEGGKPRFYNRAFLITPDQKVFKYDKTHLVMFGEYIPLRSFLESIPVVRRLIENVEKVAGDFTPGDRVHAIGDEKIRVGVPICFESIFPSITRKFVKDGASVIAVITNDAWFGYSSGPFQHFSVSAIRAVETRRFVLRSANTGISGAFSPTGKLLAKTELLERTSFLVKIKPIEMETIYLRYGDMFSILCVLATVGLYIYGVLRRSDI